jgi:ATP-dependent HslUV protease ATP-binding subunit HslU
MTVENIGARRLFSVLEKIMEDIAFNAPEEVEDVEVGVDMVEEKLKEMLNKVDLRKYLL